VFALEVLFWRRSEGRLGSYAFKATVASQKLSTLPLTIVNCWNYFTEIL